MNTALLKLVSGLGDAANSGECPSPHSGAGPHMRVLALALAAVPLISREAAKQLQGDHVVVLESELALLESRVEEHQPEVLIVEVEDVGRAMLRSVERVAHAHPELAIVLVGREQGPEVLLEAMRAGVREYVPTTAGSAAVVEALSRLRRRLGAAARPARLGKVIAFVPCKGGSGSTFLAANLGYELARAGRRVALIDLNLPFGEAEIYVTERNAQHSIADLAREMDRLDASLLESTLVRVSPHFGILATPQSPEDSMDVRPEHVEEIIDVARRSFDIVLLDIDGALEGIAVRGLDHADEILLVMQNSLPFVRGARRMLDVFSKLGYSSAKTRLVVNRYEPSSEISLTALEKAIGVQASFIVPNSFRAVEASINQGVPVVELHGKDRVAKSLREMAAKLAAEASGAAKR